MKKVLTLLVVFLLFVNFADAQRFKPKKDFKEAHRLMMLGNYSNAIKYLNRINKAYPDNSNVNYLMGVCYLNSTSEKHKSVYHLEKAIHDTTSIYKVGSYKEKKSPSGIFYYLGKAYHVNYKFDKAIYAFEKYKKIATDNPKRLKELEYLIQTCNNAIVLVNDSVEIKISNIGNIINTEYDEHTPVINEEEDQIIFTSRRKGSTGNLLEDDGEYFEDIYISRKVNSNWIAPEKISSNINTYGHEATIGLSPDGKELFVYRDDSQIGNIYNSILDSTGWSIPKRLGSNINTNANETHASISNNILYFTSDRKGGKGGSDIYVVKRLPNGEWSWAQNIGDVINTPYDDEGPFIHPDGRTLYFSSKGHNSMGGYDLFVTEWDEKTETWTPPLNLGYPINTTEDDVYYVLSKDEKRAYYSTEKKGGVGGRDIYVMNLLSLPERSTVVVKGVVRLANTNEIPKDVVLSVYEIKTDKLVGKYRPNQETGDYTLILRNGRDYRLECEAENCNFSEEKLTIPEGSSYYITNKPIVLDPIGVIKN